MRKFIGAGLVLVVTNVGASGWQAPQREISITIAPSQVTGAEATVPVMRTEMYTAIPFAWVEAPAALRGTAVSGLGFGVRAWREGDKARVVVYAVLDDTRAPDGRTQTPIATFAIAPGQSIEVPETEKWGASRVFVRAAIH